MADFDQIDAARRLLGLGEAATLKQVKAATKEQLIATIQIGVKR